MKSIYDLLVEGINRKDTNVFYKILEALDNKEIEYFQFVYLSRIRNS